MKWATAIKKIEKAMDEGKRVKVEYHYKRRPYHETDIVYGLAEYEWEGKTAKDIQTYHDGLSEYSHIIDEVTIEESPWKFTR